MHSRMKHTGSHGCGCNVHGMVVAAEGQRGAVQPVERRVATLATLASTASWAQPRPHSVCPALEEINVAEAQQLQHDAHTHAQLRRGMGQCAGRGGG